MNALIVLLPKRKSDTLKASGHCGTPTLRAAVEQEFYDMHGTQPAVRLLWFMAWIERRLAPFCRKCDTKAGTEIEPIGIEQVHSR